MLLNYINSSQIFQKMQISQNIINTQLGKFLLRLLGAMGHGKVRYKPIKYWKLHVEQTNMYI